LDVLAAEDGYRLEAPNLWVDVEEFERLCALGRRQESLGQGLAASVTFAQAADLYGGGFPPEIFDEWGIPRRGRREWRQYTGHAAAGAAEGPVSARAGAPD